MGEQTEQSVVSSRSDSMDVRNEPFKHVLVTYPNGKGYLALPFDMNEINKEYILWERPILDEQTLFEEHLGVNGSDADPEKKRRDILRVRLVFYGDEPIDDRTHELILTDMDPSDLDKIRDLRILSLDGFLDELDTVMSNGA